MLFKRNMRNNRQPLNAVVVIRVAILCHELAQATLTLKPKDAVSKVGEPTFLNCSTDIVSRDVHWMHGNNYVYAGGYIQELYLDRFHIDKNQSPGVSNLIIPAVEARDAGEYSCADDGGTGDSAVAQLIVFESDPHCVSNINTREVIGPNSCDIKPEEIQLSCGILYHGNAPPTVQWKSAKNNRSISANLTCDSSAGQMTCNATMTTEYDFDGTFFICEIENVQKHSCRTDVIRVLYAFNSTEVLEKHVADEVICSANTSNGLVCRYQWRWFENEDSLTMSNNETLRIVIPGMHRCEATCDLRGIRCMFVASQLFASLASTTTHTTATDPVVLAVVIIPICLSVVMTIYFVIYKKRRKKNSSDRYTTGYDQTNELELPIFEISPISVQDRDGENQIRKRKINKVTSITVDENLIIAERFNQHRQFLEENIDPDFGLLDKLLSKGTLTRREISDIKERQSLYKRNSLLLQIITEQSKFNNLLDALRETNQVHLVNYVISNGEYKAEEFGDDWPPREKEELLIINTNQDDLIDLIEPGDLVGRLYSRGVINKRQMDTISSKLACHEKNEALLEILRRRSLKDFKVTIQCLRESNQSHIADILEKGGVVVKVHAEGLVNKTEDEIIADFKRVYNNKTPEERQRILEGIGLPMIGAKKGESIVLYVYCKTVNQLMQLKDMQDKGTLRTSVQCLFVKLLTFEQNELILDFQLCQSQFDEMTVTLTKNEYERCRSYFSGIKCRAVSDFDPEEMREQQEIELKNILQSKVIGLKDKNQQHIEFKTNSKEGQQEENAHWYEATKKPEVGGDILLDDQSGETRWMRKVEEQKPKERSEGENVKETEKESDFQQFDVENLQEPASNLVEDLEGERQFHPEEKESKSELKELEASSKGESENSEINSTEPEEDLNSYKMALSFKKGDILETVLPEDIGYEILEATNQTEYLESATSNTSINDLPLELLDSILQKSYLQHVLRKKQFLNNKDSNAISQMASVDCCWFQRIRRRKFKRELWRRLIAFYRSKEEISSVYRISRQYLGENIQLQGLVNRLKSNDCLTDAQAAVYYNFSLGNKKNFKRFEDLISEIVKNAERIHSVFRRCLSDTKQNLIAEVIENGGAMTKVEIKLQNDETSVKRQHQKIVERIIEIRDKMKILRSHQIVELMSKLKEDDLEIFSADQDGDVIIVWIQCNTKHALEKLQTLNKSKQITEFFTELIKNLSISSQEQNPAMIKPRFNINFEQFKKTVVFFSIVANFTSRLDLRRRKYDHVMGVTKLRNKIHVLLSRSSSAPRCEILVFEDEIPFRLQNRSKIEEIKDPKDIASIEMENSLYVLNYKKCVWKIKEEGDEEEKKEKIIRWLELRDYSVRPDTLSVTRDGQLLFVCQRKKDDPLWSLWIFGGSEEADLRLSILLPKDILQPIHAVETSRGSFILLHLKKKSVSTRDESGTDGGKRQMEKVVSEVSGDGKTILSRFIPKNKEQKLSSYNFGHLVVDSFDRVFLADCGKDRVILFDSNLQWNGIIISTEEDGKEGRKIYGPKRLFYDEQKKELIVGGRKEVFIYTLNKNEKN